MNILKLADLEVKEIEEILEQAAAFKSGIKKINYNGEKIIANLFFEPSTRTHYSFETAELKLGCKTIDFAPESSSIKKGETLYDTVKTFESLGVNAVVIRHREDEYYKQLENIKIPILNGGDGTKDHPSQSLLDLYTIKEEFGHFEGLKVLIVGDIKHSRVAHSNIKVMERLGMKVYTSGPEEFKDDNLEFVNFEEYLPKVDVVMLLRIQLERHNEKVSIDAKEYNSKYGLNTENVAKMKDDAIIMHPAPFNRNVEISDDVVECSKSRIFKQITNGVYVRMAMIEKALKDMK
ncbi:MAG: aspartate carbamoyltransferase catalytic subunit [Clostridia bacterium]|nr:aspartate carbamoyltransferase catalytic subunit [Clostridia bacterium]